MSMFMSRQKIAEALRGRDVPRLLTRPAMDRLIAYAAGVMPERTVARITNDLVEAGVLGRVQRNVYVNRLASPDVTIEEIVRSEEHTSELQSLMRISYAVFCLTTKN